METIYLLTSLAMIFLIYDLRKRFKIELKSIREKLDDIHEKVHQRAETQDISSQKTVDNAPLDEAIKIDLALHKHKLVAETLQRNIEKEKEKEKEKEINEPLINEQNDKTHLVGNDDVEDIFDPKTIRERLIKETVTHEEKVETTTGFINKNKQKFFEKYPDIEKFIGENLFNKIGILILVLGLIFSVKYAIDEGLVNKWGRVGIGVLGGGILIGIAHYLRKKFSAFSSVLVGGGMAVLFFTIFISYHDYGIFSRNVAFAMLVVITAFTVLLSILYDRQELAVLAVLGGFGTPFLVNNNSGDYVSLFSYLLMLNIGMAVLALFKRWKIVDIVSFVFTLIIYGIWLGISIDDNAERNDFIGGFLFATAFYFVFFVMNVINNLRYRKTFKPLDFSILLSNTFFYFVVGLLCINEIAPELKGIFTVVIAVFNFMFAYPLYRLKRIDKNFVFLLIGLILTFISLAAPIQLEGNYITLFWAAESVLLLWMAQNTGIKIFRFASLIVMSAMLFSLLIDWGNIYVDEAHKPDVIIPLIFNKGLITSLAVVVSLGLSALLLRREGDTKVILSMSANAFRNNILVALIGVLYIGLLLDIEYQAFKYSGTKEVANVFIGAYNYLFAICILVWTKIKKFKYLKEATIGFGILTMISYFGFYYHIFNEVRTQLLENLIPAFPFYFHFVNTALVLGITWLTYKLLHQIYEANHKIIRFSLWTAIFVSVFTISSELDNILVIGFADDLLDSHDVLHKSHLIGFPVVWSIFSFVLIVLGLRKENRDLRIISLTIFFLTIIKLFAYDLWKMDEGGRIVSFIILGVILLIVSFMYQKLKQLIFENEKNEEKRSMNG